MICGVNYFVQGLAHRRKYSQNPVPFERSDTLGVFVIWAQNWGGGEPYVFCSTNRFLQGVIEIRDRVVLRGEVKRCEDDLTHSYFLALKRFNPVLGNFFVFGVCVRVRGQRREDSVQARIVTYQYADQCTCKCTHERASFTMVVRPGSCTTFVVHENCHVNVLHVAFKDMSAAVVRRDHR
jgi:hypothetical protein